MFTWFYIFPKNWLEKGIFTNLEISKLYTLIILSALLEATEKTIKKNNANIGIGKYFPNTLYQE